MGKKEVQRIKVRYQNKTELQLWSVEERVSRGRRSCDPTSRLRAWESRKTPLARWDSKESFLLLCLPCLLQKTKNPTALGVSDKIDLTWCYQMDSHYNVGGGKNLPCLNTIARLRGECMWIALPLCIIFLVPGFQISLPSSSHLPEFSFDCLLCYFQNLSLTLVWRSREKWVYTSCLDLMWPPTMACWEKKGIWGETVSSWNPCSATNLYDIYDLRKCV